MQTPIILIIITIIFTIKMLMPKIIEHNLITKIVSKITKILIIINKWFKNKIW